MHLLPLSRAAFARLALVAIIFLSACSVNLPKFTGFVNATPRPAASQVSGAASTPTAAVELPTGPADTATPSGQPGGQIEITSKDFSDAGSSPGGLILFTSAAAQPFARLSLGTARQTGAAPYLWAISLDGTRAGRVSPEGYGSAIFQAAGKKSRVVEYGFRIAGEAVEPVDPPAECKDAGGQPCGPFAFSPDGKTLTFFSGSAGACGRTLNLYNIEKQKVDRTWQKAHWSYFFDDGSLILALGDCDQPMAYLYIPRTGKQAGFEKIGKAYWNPTRTAVIYQVQGKDELSAGLWGFNLETSRVFLYSAKETVRQDNPVWLADGKNFVFQHQAYTYDRNTRDFILNGPRQVIQMDAWTRAQRLLAFDGRNDYHLCGQDNQPKDQPPGSPCTQPYGDFLRIERRPFQPLRFKAADLDKPEVRCGLYGLDCKEPPETLALNWKTGAQNPWSEARVPSATVTPVHQQPDLDHDPFYSDPGGQFEFFLGKDGRSLWYVPRDREPALWVQDGQGFTILP